MQAPPSRALESAGEGIGGPEYTDIKAAAEPKTEPQPSVEKPATAAAPTPKPPISSDESTREAPTPPPKNAPLPNAETERDLVSDKPSAAVITEPPQSIEPEESVAAQGMTINDRTLQQEKQDSDVPMPDAPPIIPAIPDESIRKAQDFAQKQTNLPPPPPRNGISPTENAAAGAIMPTEPPKWLLPPLSPRLAGRKCLVLDLDETLVHSSFKVCFASYKL